MKTYYRDFYGCTASITTRSNGSAKLVIRTSQGILFLNRTYDTERGAQTALGKNGSCWRVTGREEEQS